MTPTATHHIVDSEPTTNHIVIPNPPPTTESFRTHHPPRCHFEPVTTRHPPRCHSAPVLWVRNPLFPAACRVGLLAPSEPRGSIPFFENLRPSEPWMCHPPNKVANKRDVIPNPPPTTLSFRTRSLGEEP